eukprot:3613052-Pleurochrysis_carterae.AAC.3
MGLTFPDDYGVITSFRWLPKNVLLVCLSNGLGAHRRSPRAKLVASHDCLSLCKSLFESKHTLECWHTGILFHPSALFEPFASNAPSSCKLGAVHASRPFLLLLRLRDDGGLRRAGGDAVEQQAAGEGVFDEHEQGVQRLPAGDERGADERGRGTHRHLRRSLAQDPSGRPGGTRGDEFCDVKCCSGCGDSALLMRAS